MWRIKYCIRAVKRAVAYHIVNIIQRSSVSLEKGWNREDVDFEVLACSMKLKKEKKEKRKKRIAASCAQTDALLMH